MRKLIALVAAALLIMAAASASAGEVQTSPTRPDGEEAGWNLPESIKMTEEVTAIFNRAMEGLVGVTYEPLGYLGEKDGVYCILCRATVVYPGAKPCYALVYVTGTGVQNIWDIWMDKHAQ
uniref:Uncharacterized protein n=1 Tax=uncultured bacterium Contigcl_23 TaxID=1393667 RepID=W0FQ43_9BACT|nr:hypothetical protein [uncultured bacterium Contigcl_23]